MQETQLKRQRIDKLYWFRKGKDLAAGDVVYINGRGLCAYQGEHYKENNWDVYVVYDEGRVSTHVTSDQLLLATKEEKVAYWKKVGVVIK